MNANINTPVIPISWGELIDKITILQIKELRIEALDAKENICKELELLLEKANLDNLPKAIEVLKHELSDVNLKLWDVEEKIRLKELEGEFDQCFIELARSVYRLNDLRAKVKRSINTTLNSELIEEKSYRSFSK